MQTFKNLIIFILDKKPCIRGFGKAKNKLEGFHIHHHREKLHAAALRKQERYSPLIYALDYYISQGWIIHVIPLVVGIRGLIHLPHIHALLKFLDTPQKHWSTTLATVTIQTYAASVTPTRPSTASVVATMSFVSALPIAAV
jgi:hypothetical protein